MKTQIQFFLLIITCCLTNSIYGQVTVALVVDPNPSPQISRWVDSPGLAMLTVSNSSPSLVDSEYQIKIELYFGNSLVMNTNSGVSVQYLELGAQLFFAEDMRIYFNINY